MPLLSEGVGLYRSRDGAETWEKVNASQRLLYPKDFSVHPDESSKILLGVCDAGRGDESGGLYYTENGGQDWQRHRPRRKADFRRILPPPSHRLDLHDAHRRRPWAPAYGSAETTARPGPRSAICRSPTSSELCSTRPTTPRCSSRRSAAACGEDRSPPDSPNDPRP